MKYLAGLSDRAVKSMGMLHVAYGRGRHPQYEAISVYDTGFKFRQTAWMRLCQRLGQRLRPGIIKMSFVADLRDETTAQIVLEGFEYLPALRELSVRLGSSFVRQPGLKLGSIFQDLVMKKSCRRGRRDGFPLERLPLELQRKILLLTGLVRPGLCHWENSSPLGGRNASQGVQCCRDCGIGPENDGTPCCACSLAGSASSTCTCLPIPFGLFGTSRHIRREAAQIFFGHNSFPIPGSIDNLQKQLLKGPAECLPMLRTLVGPTWLGPNSLVEWEKTLPALSLHCNLAKVWVKLVCHANTDPTDLSDARELCGRLDLLLRKYGLSYFSVFVQDWNRLVKVWGPDEVAGSCHDRKIPWFGPGGRLDVAPPDELDLQSCTS